METLIHEVQNLAIEYWNETGDETVESFPKSVVRFVLEYAINYCHFPPHYSEDKKIEIMTQYQNSLAMCCVDVYSKAGAEGEKSHSENGISRTYKNSYIDRSLLEKLTNFVTVM